MALKEPFMVKANYNLGAGESFTLTADTGESLLIKDIFVMGESAKYCVVSIDRDTVGFFRLNAHPLSRHLLGPYKSDNIEYSSLASIRSKTLLSLMINKGYFAGYPIAEGQKFVVSPYPSTAYLGKVMVVYEKYDAGDIKKEDINGSEAKEYVYVAYGRISEEVKTAGDYVYDTIINPEEFSDFPFERECPAKTKMEVLGITGWEVESVADGSNYTYTKYLKIFKGRKLLFDDDKNGIPCYQTHVSDEAGHYGGRGFSLLGLYTPKDYRLPLIFDTPVSFSSGEELRLVLNVSNTGSGSVIDEEYSEVGLILRAKIME